MAAICAGSMIERMSRTGSSSPAAHAVLVAGGGVAGLETLLALRELAAELVDLELVAPETHFWYRPLSVAEPFGLGEAQPFELAGIAEACSARFTLGGIASVDAGSHLVLTGAGAEMQYDSLVLAFGARPEPMLPGAFTFRGPADSRAYRRALDRLERGARLCFTLPPGQTWPCRSTSSRC